MPDTIFPLHLADLVEDSAYSLTQFTEEEREQFIGQVFFKERKGKQVPHVKCAIRNKEILLTPEETVRQLYVQVLMQRYGYPVSRMRMEYPVHFGREVKRADIAVMDADRPDVPYIIVEVKKPKLKDGKEQLRSYCNATGAPIGVWTNGGSLSRYHRKDPNYFEDISDLPTATQKLADVLNERFTIADLIQKDKLVNEKKSLKDLMLEMEDEVLANAGVDVFEEVFKLIFTKLYDEWLSGRSPDRVLEFRNSGQTDAELKAKIQRLFETAKRKWEGVFSTDSIITLSPSHLSVCVSSLQDVKLFNSNLDVVDEAFEHLINKSSKGEKGQYFTPRYVIDMCVKMMNPKADEYLIDTAAGSAGFTVHSIFHVWSHIRKKLGLPVSSLMTTEQRTPEEVNYVQDRVFAIDFDERSVRVARTLNLIAGDGQTNVLHLNTLDYERWPEVVREDAWNDTYLQGWKKLRALKTEKDSYRSFGFDVLMANPPFAGDIKESRILAKYDLGKKPNGKWQTAVSRDVLFIERNLDFLKPGGRMAIVLPQGRFNNASDKNIREYITERCRILAVVGLHGNTFKPHTGTKTSVLFVQKWNDDPAAGPLCPKAEDYNIFFATMQKPGKDNSGEKIFVKAPRRNPEHAPATPAGETVEELTTQGQLALQNAENIWDSLPNNEALLDEHGHLIVDHDLYNHEGLTQDGIAEAFIEFAKKEGLSFFP